MRLVGFYERRALRKYYMEREELNLAENEEIRAFYTADFLHARKLTIGEMMFYVDNDKKCFVLPKEPKLTYAIDVVLADEDFMLMVFNKDEDEPYDNT